jgi:hypothetical protein
LGDEPPDFALGKARCDVFRAVPVERLHRDDHPTLDPCPIIGRLKAGNECRLRVLVDQACASPNLEPALRGIVHQEQADPVIPVEVADRDVLAVAREVGIADRPWSQYLQKTHRSAAVLDVGPAVLAHGALVEAVTCTDELDLDGAELNRFGIAQLG